MPRVELPELHDGRDGLKEAFKLVNMTKRRFNEWPGIDNVTLVTPGDGAYATIWGETVPLGACWKVRADIVCSTNDVTVSGCFTIDAAFANAAGTLAVVGASSQVTFARGDDPSIDAQFDTSASVLSLQVKDDGAAVTNWRALVYVQEL